MNDYSVVPIISAIRETFPEGPLSVAKDFSVWDLSADVVREKQFIPVSVCDNPPPPPLPSPPPPRPVRVHVRASCMLLSQLNWLPNQLMPKGASVIIKLGRTVMNSTRQLNQSVKSLLPEMWLTIRFDAAQSNWGYIFQPESAIPGYTLPIGASPAQRTLAVGNDVRDPRPDVVQPGDLEVLKVKGSDTGGGSLTSLNTFTAAPTTAAAAPTAASIDAPAGRRLLTSAT